jgi:hypothetical protein
VGRSLPPFVNMYFDITFILAFKSEREKGPVFNLHVFEFSVGYTVVKIVTHA